MAKPKFEDLLEKYNCHLTLGQFRDVLADAAAEAARDCTDERIVCFPALRKPFLRAVRRRLGLPKFPEGLINWGLLNSRKAAYKPIRQ